MIRHTYRRPPGGARYSTQQRAAARAARAAGSPDTVSAKALAAMTDPGGIFPVLDVLFELESNRLGRNTTVILRLDGTSVLPVTGSRGLVVDSKRAGLPTIFPTITASSLATVDAVVELTWAGGRRVNVVEIHGSPSHGQITAAAVDIRTAASQWVPVAAVSSSAGHLSATFPEVVCHGVRVHLDAVSGAGSGQVAVVEVDPMFVLDVSDDVVAVEVEWSRETAPGTSTDPVGSYEASSVTLELEDTLGQWNPATNASLDVGHRIEVAFGVAFDDPSPIEELFPAGVFYSDPFDTDSTSSRVSITGTDRLGRNAETTPSEPVLVNSTVQAALVKLAGTYLDLVPSQVIVDPSVGGLVFPYLYPSGTVGSYFADLAKATGSTVHLDALDRLVFARRADTGPGTVATITDETALLSYRRPPGYDVTTSVVTVTARPLTLGAVTDLWAMPSGGIRVEIGQTYLLVAEYGSVPAVNAFLSGVVADGSYTVTVANYYAERAELSIRNNETARALVVADLRVRGNPLVEASLTARREDPRSVTRYGPRSIDVDARLVQTQTQVELIADVLLDAFRSIDDDGTRRLPDLTFDALGLLHVEAGDRVTLAYPSKGLGGDYTVLGRRLSYTGGALLSTDVRVRETPDPVVYMTADSGLLTDSGVLAGY